MRTSDLSHSSWQRRSERVPSRARERGLDDVTKHVGGRLGNPQVAGGLLVLQEREDRRVRLEFRDRSERAPGAVHDQQVVVRKGDAAGPAVSQRIRIGSPCTCAQSSDFDHGAMQTPEH